MTLQTETARYVAWGWRVEYASDQQVVLSGPTGTGPNHVLHAVLTLVTLGFWLFVWLPVLLFSQGSPQERLTLWTEDGRVRFQHFRGAHVVATGEITRG